MRETQKGQSETQDKLTLVVPMNDDKTYDKALSVFNAIDGALPNVADCIVVDDTYMNDAAYSCRIRPNLAEGNEMMCVGIKLFLGNPDEGFEAAQMYVGDDLAQTLDTYGDFDGEFTDLDALSAWLDEQMTTATHPLFKSIGMAPLVIDSIDKVRAYQTILASFGLQYHMDDGSWDCLYKVPFSIWERVLLYYYHCACLQVCNVEGEDIHGICLEVFNNYDKTRVEMEKLWEGQPQPQEWVKVVNVWKDLPTMLQASIEK
jgi:hypothetical protein